MCTSMNAHTCQYFKSSFSYKVKQAIKNEQFTTQCSFISIFFTFFQESEHELKEEIPSTLQIIISRVSEAQCNSKTVEEDDHCSTEDTHADEYMVVDHDNNT